MDRPRTCRALAQRSKLRRRQATMQLSLHADGTSMPHEQAISEHSSALVIDSYVCSCAFRPPSDVEYEHMFSSSQKRSLGQRTFSALLLVRSFLLLEDDCEVDWEVDQAERSRQARLDRAGPVRQRNPDGGVHPHRFVLDSRLGARRPGAPTPCEQVCLCPGKKSNWGDDQNFWVDIPATSRNTRS